MALMSYQFFPFIYYLRYCVSTLEIPTSQQHYVTFVEVYTKQRCFLTSGEQDLQARLLGVLQYINLDQYKLINFFNIPIFIDAK